MNFSDIKAIQQIADSNIDPRAALVQQAGDRVLQEYHGSLMFPLVATLGGVGYCLSVLASGPLAIAVGLLGGFYMIDKVQRGERAFDDIENGRIERYLNEQQRRVLKQLPPVEDVLALDAAPSQAVEVAAVPVGNIAAPPISAQWNPQQWALWNRLVQDCPELRYALMCKLLVVSGPQQTGKSSLASAIAYLRRYLIGWETIAVTPHIDGEKIFAGDVIGVGQNFEQIQEFYTDLKEDFTMGGNRRSLVVDELTQYSDGHEKLGQSIVRTALSESDKHGWNPILINHATTVSAGFADIRGVSKLIENSAVQLVRQYEETAWGEQVRSSEVKLTRPGKPEVALTIPDWLYLATLKAEYPVVPVEDAPQVAAVTAPPPTPPQQSEPANPFQLTSEILERIYQVSPSDVEPTPIEDEEGEDRPLDTKALEGLPKELREIVKFAHRRNEWVTAREVKARVWMLRNASVTTEAIRGYFQQLASQNLGCVEGIDENLKYRF